MSTDDESFHPLGEDWEAEMEERLEESEYDAELGIEMAKDAQRMVAGEITEDEFYDRYHDDVVEEFGVDDRPMAERIEAEREEEDDDGPLFGSISGIRGGTDSEMPRREMMQKMGAAGAFLGLGAWATKENVDSPDEPASVAAAQEDDDEDDLQWGMVIDLDRCDGCLECVRGCQEENNWDEGTNWMYVFTYEEPHEEGYGLGNFLVRPCQHCGDAPCEQVCPVEARHTRTSDGLVLTDYDICIGCRYCQVACPYGVNYFGWEEPDLPIEEQDPDERYAEYPDEGRERHVDHVNPKGTMGKCTMCPTRQDDPEQRGTVACMDACDDAGMSAIHFGNLNDPESRPRQYLEAQEYARSQQFTTYTEDDEDAHENVDDDEEWWNPDFPDNEKLKSFRLLEHMGTDPNVIYLGNEPSDEAEQVEGPVSYEAVGSVDNRKEVLDEGTFFGGAD